MEEVNRRSYFFFLPLLLLLFSSSFGTITSDKKRNLNIPVKSKSFAEILLPDHITSFMGTRTSRYLFVQHYERTHSLRDSFEPHTHTRAKDYRTPGP